MCIRDRTYPLPEAQVDRFMLKTVIDYPKMDEERLVIRQNLKGSYEKVNAVVSVEQILRAQEAVREVYMDEKIEKYILDIIFATRFPEKYKLESLKPLISFGSSPRGSINSVSYTHLDVYKRQVYLQLLMFYSFCLLYFTFLKTRITSLKFT